MDDHVIDGVVHAYHCMVGLRWFSDTTVNASGMASQVLHCFSIWRYIERKNLEKKIKNRRINQKSMLNVRVAIAQWKFKNNYMLFIFCSAVKTSKAKSIGFCILLYCSSWVERLRPDAVITKNNLQTKSRLTVRTCIVLLRPVKYVPLPLSSCRFQPNPRFCQINRKYTSKINCPNESRYVLEIKLISNANGF